MSANFEITSLGKTSVDSPILLSNVLGDRIANYVSDDECILYDINVKQGEKASETQHLEKAGPRSKLFFNPGHVHAAIVTCGGLCPGLNDVIRSTVRSLWHRYGVRRITGITNGYKGFLPEFNLSTMELNPSVVDDIHKMGGSVLGSSRGQGERTSEIVDALERMNINMLFTIGGDGTQKGALKISQEIQSRGLKISVVGIPKTIDNDLSFIQKSFGFETAVAKASDAVTSAHTEAHSAINGVGLVKLMGRESGFIAAQTALASHEANFVLIPEVPFELEGTNGLLTHLKKRLEKRKHAVIIVAEGAGQDLMDSELGEDASGNKKLGNIGTFLSDKIKGHFKSIGMEINLKYIDPSYIVRSAPAIPNDSAYCTRLAAHAVHAAMAGKTGMLVSLIHNTFVHVPMEVAVGARNKVDPESSLWRDVIDSTQMPVLMSNKK